MAVALDPLALDSGPPLAADDVDDASNCRVADGRPLEQRHHHVVERNALLGVQAPVDRVHHHERKRRAEGAQAHLLGQNRELHAAIRDRLQLLEDDRLGCTVELHRSVAARAHPELLPPGVGAGKRRDDVTHPRADAEKCVQPVRAKRGQVALIECGPGGADRRLRLRGAGRRGRPDAGGGGGARPRW